MDYIEIYFAAPDDLATVATRVSKVIGAQLEPSDEPYADYMGRRDGVVYDLKFGHDLEDDVGIPFERMPYTLTVRGARDEQARHEALAKAAFEELKDDYHPIYVVLGVSKVLAFRD
jgi:hypothetical protein